MIILKEVIIDMKAKDTGGVKIVRLNEWKKDITSVTDLIEMLKNNKKEHGNFRVLVSNDGKTINLFLATKDKK